MREAEVLRGLDGWRCFHCLAVLPFHCPCECGLTGDPQCSNEPGPRRPHLYRCLAICASSPAGVQLTWSDFLPLH